MNSLSRIIAAVLAFAPLTAIADHIPGHHELAAADIAAIKRFAVQGNDGETHYTGLLRSPKDAPKVFFQPFAPELVAELAAELPDNYNGDTEGFGTEVKDQGQCGSCSFFARTAAYEGSLLKAGYFDPATLDLSEQDHMMNGGEYECSGGFMDGDWLTANGETTEDVCPYTGRDNRPADRCNSAGKKVSPKPGRWVQMGTSSRAPTIDEMRVAIATYGPLAVTVASGGLSPNSDGRVTGRSCNARGIDHMTTAVGWEKVGNEYWLLVRNSWGKRWGRQGYYVAKPGCTQLASDPGDAAMFYVVESDGPAPQPTTIDGLPYEVIAPKGKEVALQAKPVKGNRYKWTVGTMVQTGSRIYVQTTTPTTAELAVTAPDKSVTTYTVKIGVK